MFDLLLLEAIAYRKVLSAARQPYVTMQHLWLAWFHFLIAYAFSFGPNKGSAICRKAMRCQTYNDIQKLTLLTNIGATECCCRKFARLTG